MSDKGQIEFRCEGERTQWLAFYDRVLLATNDPWMASERASADMEIRRRVWPPPGELDKPMLISLAREALDRRRMGLDGRFDSQQIDEIDAVLASIDRMRGQP